MHRSGGPRMDNQAAALATSLGAATVDLSDRDQQILAFERQWWKYAGAKEQAIRELFAMSATRYYQVLNALIDSPAALAHDPMPVSYTHLRAHETRPDLVCRLLLEK